MTSAKVDFVSLYDEGLIVSGLFVFVSHPCDESLVVLVLPVVSSLQCKTWLLVVKSFSLLICVLINMMISCFVVKTSENCEKCPLIFPRAQEV